jgi:2-polyprenyl-6-methoxyphenol hydroxylase-like FAD-dependent oxidoreductase
MKSTRHALVIGGGIAGPVVAMFLQKAGISSAIYEARESAEEVSSCLQIAPNGMNVLKAIDMDSKVTAAGAVTSHLCFRNSRGKFLSRIENGNPEAHGAPAVTIVRATLHCVLVTEAIARGIPVNFGKRLVRIEDLPGQPVVAHFEDGSSARGDIIIGADGIWSAVRRLTMPEAPQPVYTGLLGVGGLAPVPDSPARMLANQKEMTMTWGPSGFFGYGMCRVPQGKAIMWWSNQPQQTPPTRQELKSVSQEELRRNLAATHDDWHDPIPQLIETTDEVLRIAIYEMPALPAWHTGRAVLIGDAAHAMATSAGQGASQALEDTIALAKLLRDEPGPMQNAFAGFEKLRRSRAEKVSAMSRRNSDRKKTLGPFGLRVRDFFVAHLLPVLAGRSWNAMYAYKIDW